MAGLCRDVEVDRPDGGMGCYVSFPSRPNGSALVVLQEIFGVNGYIRGLVKRFGDAGFAAIAPDLYWRQAPAVQLDPSLDADRERAMVLMKGLDTEQVLADAIAALVFAQGGLHESVSSCAVGYCFGGKIAFLMATRGVVDAAVSYYGVGIHNVLDEARGIKGRVLLHIAQEDHLCSVDAQAEIASELAKIGPRAKVISYPGVGHAFARQGSTSFDRDAAERADCATLAFLSERSP